MLIILSGSETIHKKFIARAILSALIPTFPLTNGYTMNFNKHPFEIFDSTGKSVYRPATDTDAGTNEILHNSDGSFNADGQAILTQADQAYSDILLSGVRDSHFGNFFVDLESDFGDTGGQAPEWESKPSQYNHPHTYDDVVARYNNRKFPVSVITGNFSKRFIDMIRVSIGAANVKVYNIIRNPSVAFTLHEKPASYYIEKPAMSTAIDRRKIQVATFNCASLIRFSDITTLRFEQLIVDGQLTINGTTIKLPPEYVNYNGLITAWEKDFAAQRIVSDADITSWNAWCEAPTASDPTEDVAKVSRNLFTALGYSPLTYNQVTAAPRA